MMVSSEYLKIGTDDETQIKAVKQLKWSNLRVKSRVKKNIKNKNNCGLDTEKVIYATDK